MAVSETPFVIKICDFAAVSTLVHMRVTPFNVNVEPFVGVSVTVTATVTREAA